MYRLNKNKLIITILIIISIGFVLNPLVSMAENNTSGGSNLKEGQLKLTPSIIVVLILVGIIVILFFFEPIRLDIIAISIPAILVLLKPWTEVGTKESLSGFANTATITVLAMFIISEGIQRNGIVQILGDKIAKFTGDNELKQLAAITGIGGTIACILNNTPVVAIFIPMVMNLSRKTKTSPSKLLMPLSYASMMGGMITLIGTSTNLLASDVSERLLGKPFSMFEFTNLGIIVLLFGWIYLLTLGRYLTPKRVDPEKDLIENYYMKNFVTEVVVEEGSPLLNKEVQEIQEEIDIDMKIIEIIRGESCVKQNLEREELKVGDHLIVNTNRKNILKIIDSIGLSILPETKITEDRFKELESNNKLLQIVIPYGSLMEGQTLEEMNFLKSYETLILAIRRGDKLLHSKMENIKLKSGDVLLLLATENTEKRLEKKGDFIVIKEVDSNNYDTKKMITSVSILAIVISLAVFEIVHIAVAAILGVVAMIVTGCLKAEDIYDAVNWQVIFLLAGLIPLGIAMEKTGTAKYIANKLLLVSGELPPTIVLGIFYISTAVLTNIISNNASVVLMIPVAIDAANQLGVNPFTFVIVVTFAASTAFLTPVGYQTNLMVYAPGEYKFKDFMIAGAPLQILLAIITPIFAALIWGL